MQHVAAGLELVAHDHGVRNHNGNRGENSCRSVVARLEQIRNRILREPPRPSRNHRDHDQSGPAARRLPQRGESVAVSVLPTRK